MYVKIAKLQTIIKTREESLDDLNHTINRVKFESMQLELTENRSEIIELVQDLAHRISLKLMNIQRIRDASRLFLKLEVQATPDDIEEMNEHHKKIDNLQEDLGIINQNISTLQNITAEYAQLLIESNYTLHQLTELLNKNDSIRIEQLKEMRRDQQRIQFLEGNLTTIKSE